ncbi:MAG: hypothetical protein ACJASL_001255, partial [Paraglaciecola sp.]
MGKSQRKRQLKDCNYCAKSDSVLYRIRLQQTAPWEFACSDCQSKVKNQPQYQYGGTWKQKK